MRYKVVSEWQDETHDREPYCWDTYDEDANEYLTHTLKVQSADIQDTKSSQGTVYRNGAYRVVLDGKPVKGKGGTTPFFGEMAWADAARLFDDKCWEARRTMVW